MPIKRNIPFVVLAGESEMQAEKFTLEKYVRQANKPVFRLKN
jgi:hypothetical protein